MTKLAKYLKPYIAVALAALVLLFAQAMLDLSLPNMMSDIVNVGIQKGGITETSPRVIPKAGLDLMLAFMPANDKAIIEQSYLPVDKSSMEAGKYKKTLKAFPNSEQQEALYLANESAEANLAFARAGYAFITLVKDAVPAGSTHADSDSATGALDISKLEAILPMLQALPSDKTEAAMALAAATPEMMLSQSSAVFIKSFYTQLGADTASIQNDYILLTGLKMLGFSLMLCAAAVSVGLLMSRLGAGVARDLRRDVFTKVSTFTSAELDRFSTASLITRTTNDITQIQGFLTMGLRILCFAPIMGIGGTIMALSKSSGMAWIIVLAVILIFCIIGTLFALAMPRFTKMQQLVDKLNLVSREGLSGMMVIRAFNTQSFEEKRFDKANKDLSSNSMFIFSAVSLMMPIMNLILNGICLLIVWIGGKQIAQSGMQVGNMMAFMQYAMQIMMSFLMISMMFIMLPRASVSGKRIYEVLSSDSSVKDPVAPKHLPDTIHGEIAFNDVSFHYEGADENVLEHISFTAHAGETTAFIGSTGSGKSTLINLIPRFYDVTVGSITIDGVDIRDITQHELREAIGYVPQKGMLFSGDISSNLRLGAENAPDALLREASATAQATEFIDELEAGFAGEISQGGTNVSGGQRQRLSIARALVKKAPIYIFDDTFSALDFKTDAALREALDAYTGGANVLIVAQRISTIVHSQQIIVLDEGHIVGIGTHEELMNTCDTYREIAASQLPKEELKQWEK